MKRAYLSIAVIGVALLGLWLLSVPVVAQGGDQLAASRTGLYLLSEEPNGLLLEYRAPALTMEKVWHNGIRYQKPSLAKHGTLGSAGDPQLPQLGALVALPDAAQATVTILDSHVQVLSDMRLIPIPRLQLPFSLPGRELADVALQPIFEEGHLYRQDAFWPSQIVTQSDPLYFRDQLVAAIQVAPLQYNPVQGQVLCYDYLQIWVQFQASDEPRPGRPESAVFEAALAANVLNYHPPKTALLSSAVSASVSLHAVPDQFKIKVSEEGVYHLTYAALQAAGLPVDTLDPRTLQLFDEGQEVAIWVVGEGDGSFDPHDRVVFYGVGLETKYASGNVYWLQHGQQAGLRMSERLVTPTSGAPVFDRFWNIIRLEQNRAYWGGLPGDDEFDRWYWEYILAFGAAAQRSYGFELSDIASGSITSTIESVFHSTVSFKDVNPDHHAQITLNGTLIDDSWWDGAGTFEVSAEFPQSVITDGANSLVVRLPGDTGALYDYIITDWFELEYLRKTVAQSDVLFFDNAQPGTWEHRVTGFTTNDLLVFDVTDPASPVMLTNPTVLANGDYGLAFEDTVTDTKRYAALAAAALMSPISIEQDTPSDLKNAANGADYIVITHADFMTQATWLANYRQTQNGYRTMVVDVQDIYDEFNDGVMHPRAMRDFLRHAYENWQSPAPSFVVLFGDGHTDPKNYRGTSSPVYIPPYLAFADPFIGETAVDERITMVAGDDLLPDLHLGRLPVNTQAQADAVIEKIEEYEQSPVPGDWTEQLLFVADDQDAGGPFELFSNALITDYVSFPFVAHKAYVRDLGNGTRNKVVNDINAGRLLVNYIGHGATDYWASNPRILQISDIASMNNKGQYPIMLPLTCADGYFLDPQRSSLSETIVRAPDKGAVASWAAAGFGLITGHDYFNRGFLQAVLVDHEKTLGNATMAGKVKLFTEGPKAEHFHLETYILMGDPALQLPNHDPVPGTADPSAVESNEDVFRTVTTTLLDGDGYEDIREAYFLVNTITDTNSGIYGRYDQQANLIHLWDPAQNDWVGGYAPGVAQTISTANGELDVSQCLVAGDLHTLTVTWTLACKAPMVGDTYNQYLKVRDMAKAHSEWKQVGTWLVGEPPAVEGLAMNPALATPWATQVFTTTYSDPDGGADIALADMLINHGAYSAYGVHLCYDQAENLVYLRNDLDTGWLGGYAPGTVNLIQNGQVKVMVEDITVGQNGDELAVSWALQFKPWFIGWRRNVYLRAFDLGDGSSGWMPSGVWKVR